MIFIKQCKGKDLDKVAKSKLQKGLYYQSKKYDGNYVQIHKIGDEVIFFSSGGIRFYLEDIANYLIKWNEGINFILEAEYIADTNGMLGSRGACTTTTFRTNTKKGIENRNTDTKRFMVFDCIFYHDTRYFNTKICPTELEFEFRKRDLIKLNLGQNLLVVEHTLMTFDRIMKEARDYVNKGGEGFFAIKALHIYNEGKKTNDAIKFKFYPVKDMECIGVSFGTGQYREVISSLKLRDDIGIIVNVGGVLIGELGISDAEYFLRKVYRIEYESFDKTYIQPRFYKEKK